MSSMNFNVIGSNPPTRSSLPEQFHPVQNLGRLGPNTKPRKFRGSLNYRRSHKVSKPCSLKVLKISANVWIKSDKKPPSHKYSGSTSLQQATHLLTDLLKQGYQPKERRLKAKPADKLNELVSGAVHDNADDVVVHEQGNDVEVIDDDEGVLMIYVCRHQGKPPKRNVIKRQLKNRQIGCLARFTIKMNPKYLHANKKDYNIEEFGDQRVFVHWTHRHNHTVIKRSDPQLVRHLDLLFRNAVTNGLTWNQWIIRRTEMLLGPHSKNIPSRILQFSYNKWLYEHRRLIRSLAIKHVDREMSLRFWAGDIREENGMAEFTDTFLLNNPANEREPATAKVWSMWFMSAWQKELLKLNCLIIFLDSTHKTCRGLLQEENVYLFTLYVKNHITGRGAPAAFMMTNSQTTEVITHFLEAVRAFAPFVPTQVVIDCDHAETNALKEVWKEEIERKEIVIVWCRWHILKAFANNVRTKIRIHARGDRSSEEWAAHKISIKEKKEEITEAFKKVIACRDRRTGEQLIEDFLEKYKEFPEFIQYTTRQWFERKEFVVNWMASNILVQSATNNYIESFHNVLKRKFLGKSRTQRPDLLVFKLFKNVENNYRADEMMATRGFSERSHDKGERRARLKANHLTNEEMKGMVTFVSEGKIEVRSFTEDGKAYSVGIDSNVRLNVFCTCEAYANSKSWCKHIFLGWRWWFTQLSDHQEQEGACESNNEDVISAMEAVMGGIEDDDGLDDACFEEIESTISESSGERIGEEMVPENDEGFTRRNYTDGDVLLETGIMQPEAANLVTVGLSDCLHKRDTSGDQLFSVPGVESLNALVNEAKRPVAELSEIADDEINQILSMDDPPDVRDIDLVDQIERFKQETMQTEQRKEIDRRVRRRTEKFMENIASQSMENFMKTCETIMKIYDDLEDNRMEASRRQRR